MSYIDATLTPEDVAHLRRPFHHNAVKWLPVGKITSNGSQGYMPHVDASLVIERLSEVDPCWSETSRPMIDNTATDKSDPFGLVHMLPWECTLTVKGVTRTGRGQLGPSGPYNNQKPPTADDKHIKSAESDALKRAALRFGVGAYLRAIPMIYLPEQSGKGKNWWATGQGDKRKVGGLNTPGKRQLRDEYVKVVGHQAFVEHYGEVVDYGDQEDIGDDVEPIVQEPDAAMPEPALLTLIELSKYTGRDTPEAVVRDTFAAQPFAKVLPRTLNSVVAILGCSATDAERLRTLAIAASEGDEAKLAEMKDGLQQLADLAAQNASEDSDEGQEEIPV